MVKIIITIALSIIFVLIAEVSAMKNYTKHNGNSAKLEFLTCIFFMLFVGVAMLNVLFVTNEFINDAKMFVLSLAPIAVSFVLPVYCMITKSFNKTKKMEVNNA